MNKALLIVSLSILSLFSPQAFGQMNGDEFFIGSNHFGEIAPTFIASEDCQITSPVPTSAIGAANMHAIIIGNGSDVNGTIRLSQSFDELSVIDENSVSCNVLGIHNGTSYYRQFDVSGLENFDLHSIEIGVEVSIENSDGSGNNFDNLVPIQICLYYDIPVQSIVHSGVSGPTGFNESFCAAISGDNSDNLTIVTSPINATVPAGTDTLVIEIFSPGRDTDPATDFCSNQGSCKAQTGDVNMDGSVNLLDVGPFVTALSSGEFLCEADVNEDGLVNLLDVDPFVNLLAGS